MKLVNKIKGTTNDVESGKASLNLLENNSFVSV